jgi:hypothetical protein
MGIFDRPPERDTDQLYAESLTWQTKIGEIVERFNAIESRIALLIQRFIGAKGSGGEFLRSRVLHNSIVSYSSKVKLILAINGEAGGPKLDRDSFHRLGALRNAFAHTDIYKSRRVNLNVDAGPVGAYFSIDLLKPDGTIKSMRRAEAVVEFGDLCDHIDQQLDGLEAVLVDTKTL